MHEHEKGNENKQEGRLEKTRRRKIRINKKKED